MNILDLKKEVDKAYKESWDFFSYYYKMYYKNGPSLTVWEDVIKKAKELAVSEKKEILNFRAEVLSSFTNELKKYYLELKDFDKYLNGSYSPMGKKEYQELNNNPENRKINSPKCYFEIFASVYSFNIKYLNIVFEGKEDDWDNLLTDADIESKKNFYSEGKNAKRDLNTNLIISVINLLGDSATRIKKAS